MEQAVQHFDMAAPSAVPLYLCLEAGREFAKVVQGREDRQPLHLAFGPLLTGRAMQLLPEDGRAQETFHHGTDIRAMRKKRVEEDIRAGICALRIEDLHMHRQDDRLSLAARA